MGQLLYHKMRQKFIAKRVKYFITKFDSFITKCDSFITKCDCYYKMCQFCYKLRQLLQNATFITECVGTQVINKVKCHTDTACIM